MGTTADKLAYLNDTKTAIKNAIGAKGVAVPDGTTFRAYADKIADIIDVPDLSNPGSASDLRSGKQLAGADGSIVTGTLPEVEQATPSISVSSGGLITATAVQVGGIVADGTKSAIQQLPTQGAATITPGTTAKTAIAEGLYTTGDIKVAGDANLVAENIAEGVSIFGVVGTHSGGGLEVVAGTMNQVQFLSNFCLAWSDGTSGHYECIYGPHSDISVLKNSIIHVVDAASVTGEVIEAKISGGSDYPGNVYFVEGPFTINY